jgi:hypothetical protein
MWRLGILFALVVRRLGLVPEYSVHLFSRKTQRLLMRAESVEVFSLTEELSTDGPFHGARVIGSVVVKSARDRKRLMNRIILANRYSLGGLKCLGSEYGVRVVAGETTLDLTFCFHCSQVWIAGPNEHAQGGTVAPFLVPLLNAILTKAGVPLPPPREH